MYKPIALAAAVILVWVVSVHSNPSQSISSAGRVKINQSKPSVFISFVKLGKREPLEAGESNEGLWLRLHNNTRWTIWLPSFSVPQGAGEIGLHYDLEEMPTSVEQREKPGVCDCPQLYSLPHQASFKPVKPGKSVLFSIPGERLASKHMLRVFFFYDWEQLIDVVTNKEPNHFVYFLLSEIPKEKTR